MMKSLCITLTLVCVAGTIYTVYDIERQSSPSFLTFHIAGEAFLTFHIAGEGCDVSVRSTLPRLGSFQHSFGII